MKIAVLAPIAWRTPPRHYGPWEQMASNLTEGLAAAGIDVTLFATCDSITSGKLNAVVGKGYEEDREADAKVLECLHISHVMEQADQFDLIHNHYDFLPLTYSGLIRTPLITTIHGFSSEKIIPVYQKYNGSGHYVSISNSDRHPALKYLSTVYNGLRTEEFDPGTGQGDYLLFFGRIHPDKGTSEAIQIALKTKRRLIIAGIVQDVNYFKERVEPFLSEEITFIGAAGPEKRNQLLGGAVALLHPINFEEPFGLSVAEAMLCETPVIAFDRGAMRELIKDHETGFLVKNTDEAVAAVEAINTIDRPGCREWVMRNFSQKKMAEDYISLYHRILD